MKRSPGRAPACTQVPFCLLLAIPIALAPAPARAQQPSIFATRVIAADTQGNAGGGTFQPQNALGAPSGKGSGGGSAHVHSLGTGGSLTLGFDVILADGPGADLLVFENPFLSQGRCYAEALYVEVSSNGSDFARFPTRYTGPSQSGGSFALSVIPHFSGFAGTAPVYAGSASNIDPQDVVQAGGDAFDLADLANDALVRNGRVKLHAIQQVRLVDVVAGISKDSRGRIVQDPTSGSADIDAVAVIHHLGTLGRNGPSVSLTVPADGRLTLVIQDPDGLVDLDPQSFRMALDGQEFPPALLLPALSVTQASGTSITLHLATALPAGWPFRLSVSVQDRSGRRSGAARTRP